MTHPCLGCARNEVPRAEPTGLCGECRDAITHREVVARAYHLGYRVTVQPRDGEDASRAAALTAFANWHLKRIADEVASEGVHAFRYTPDPDFYAN